MSRRNAPTVNSGSMADIAFLLLIFFLLTTTISADKGLKRILPVPCPASADCTQNIEERNLLRIVTNSRSELMVNDKVTTIEQIAEILIAFIDNNAEKQCNYCKGDQLTNGSEHPRKAFISLDVHPLTKYNTYIDIQDAISSAYYKLRSDYVLNVFDKEAIELSNKEIESARKAYPFNLVETSDFAH